MADRTQNINIKYTVNTVDIQAASAQLTKAQQATDALRNSATKLGSDFAGAGTKLAGTLEGLNLRLAQLKGQIDLTSTSNTAQLQKLALEYKLVQAEIDRVTKSIYGMGEASKGATTNFGGLVSLVGVFIAYRFAKELLDITLNMASLAGKIEGVKKAFDKLPNSVLLLHELTKATHGMVDELTLMQKALQAKNFGIPLEKLASLFEFATTRAQQTGISVDYLVESIVTGLGRNSIKILDNLQINIGELQKRVKETGKTTQVVAIEMIGESLKKMDKYVETSETKVNRLSVAWEHFKQGVSRKIESGGFLDYLTRSLNVVGAYLSGGANEFLNRGLKADAVEIVEKFKSDNEAVLKTKQGIFEVDLKIFNLNREYMEGVKKIKELTDERNKTGSAQGTIAQREDLRLQIEAFTQKTVQTKYTIDLLKEYGRSLKLVDAIRDEEEIPSLKEEKDKIDASTISMRAYRQELDKYFLSLQKAFKPAGLAKGSMPAGGFGVIDQAQADQDKASPNSAEANFKTWYNAYATFWDKIALGFTGMNKRIKKTNEETIQDEQRQWQQVAQMASKALENIVTSQIKAVGDRELQGYDDRISAVKTYYDKQIALAGDNENAKVRLVAKRDKELAKLEKQRGEQAKRNALTQIIINTALGITKAWATLDFYEALAATVIIAAEGASEYAIAAQAKYAKGKVNIQGKGTGTSDSIPAMISKGESVITAEATRESMGLLKAINAKKINDSMLNAIIAKNGGSQANFDAAAIVAAIKAQGHAPDIIRIGSQIYEVKRDGENSKTYIRSKYLG